MSRKYESMIVINTRGNEGSVKELVEKVTKEMEGEGVTLESVVDLGRKQFAYNARKLAAGHYLNIIFTACPDAVKQVQYKLSLNESIYMQRYLRIA
jgi:small subunit ribosomal protein S6